MAVRPAALAEKLERSVGRERAACLADAHVDLAVEARALALLVSCHDRTSRFSRRYQALSRSRVWPRRTRALRQEKPAAAPSRCRRRINEKIPPRAVRVQ